MYAVKQTSILNNRTTERVFYIYRVVVIFSFITLFIASINPARICALVNSNLSLFTSGISYNALSKNIIRAVSRGWVQESSFVLLHMSSLISLLGIAGIAAGGCMSLGSLKMRRLGNTFALAGGVVSAAGLGGIAMAYGQVSRTTNPKTVAPEFPFGFFIVAGLVVLVILLSVILLLMQPKPGAKDVYEIKEKYKLFLFLMPFIALTFIFSYLQLWGWRYAFFDYKAGGTLSAENFVGFKWFTFLFENAASRQDLYRVMKNTFAMSGLGLVTSWFAMAFAIFLYEIKNLRVRRTIQTLTTIPNFISWVLVFAVANVIFASDGLIASLVARSGGTAVNYLMDSNNIWLKMLAWGHWKGMGWSAIVYIAGISSIDPELFEAATVDGAGRFRRMWHITVPSLFPTFCVILLLSIASILSNGLDQYLVFKNALNVEDITVLDLHVYLLGIKAGRIPISTVIGMFKSIVSVVLLLGANKASKLIRGESII